MEREPWTRTRALAGLLLAGATCMMCYSVGWHCGNLNSNSEYDRRLAEMHDVMMWHRSAMEADRENAGHARTEDW